MKLLGIVPARGGSKRFPGKNIATLAGKPLIHHTLEAVSTVATTTLISSDSKEILNIGSQIQHVEKHERKRKLTSDKITVIHTVIDIIDNYSDYDYVGLFLPTAPLRTEQDIFNALRKLQNSNADGIISTTDYDFPTSLGLVLDNDGHIHCSDDSLPFLNDNTRSQDHNRVIRPNGAIYIKRMKAFKEHKNFFKGNILNYHMPKEKSVDIDTPTDLAIAELLINLE